MEGVVNNFRRAKHHQTNHHMIISVEGITSREKAAELVNKEVAWKSPADKEIKGVIKAPHGKRGAVRAIFEKALPGQSLGTKVQLK